MRFYNITLPAVDATPKNVILGDSLPVADNYTIPGNNVFLCSGVTPGTGVFPAIGDVDNGVAYGPTGTEFAGTLQQPAEADVLTGTGYGAGGTEFTGTLVGGGGGGTTFPPMVMGG